MAGQLSRMRRAIAKTTSDSFATIPHFYLKTEVDATAIEALRGRLAESVHRQVGSKLTLTVCLLRAVALALRDYPIANRIWQDDDILQLDSSNVGLVVSCEDGLMIPVIQEADTLDFGAMAAKRSGLVAAVQTGRLPADALGTAATSLSNLGRAVVDEFAPVICPPQSTMLAVGRLAHRPFVVDGSVACRQTIKLCLAVDHRVLDGVEAAAYLSHIVRLLGDPQAMQE